MFETPSPQGGEEHIWARDDFGGAALDLGWSFLSH